MNTKAHIVAAFYELVCKEAFDKLTVQDILDAADVSRSTFYRIFRDKYDLLDYFCESLILRIMSKVQEPRKGSLWREILNSIEQNKPFYIAIYQKDGHDTYEALMTREMSRRLGGDVMAEHGRTKLTREEELMLEFTVAGLTRVVRNWVKAGFPDSPEYVAEVSLQLVPELYRKYL